MDNVPDKFLEIHHLQPLRIFLPMASEFQHLVVFDPNRFPVTIPLEALLYRLSPGCFEARKSGLKALVFCGHPLTQGGSCAILKVII
jgi:hypothetical protein